MLARLLVMFIPVVDPPLGLPGAIIPAADDCLPARITPVEPRLGPGAGAISTPGGFEIEFEEITRRIPTLFSQTDIVSITFDFVFLEQSTSQGICLEFLLLRFPSPCSISSSLHDHGEDPQMVNLVFK